MSELISPNISQNAFMLISKREEKRRKEISKTLKVTTKENKNKLS